MKNKTYLILFISILHISITHCISSKSDPVVNTIKEVLSCESKKVSCIQEKLSLNDYKVTNFYLYDEPPGIPYGASVYAVKETDTLFMKINFKKKPLIPITERVNINLESEYLSNTRIKEISIMHRGMVYKRE